MARTNTSKGRGHKGIERHDRGHIDKLKKP
jgi:hypothetical protein